VNRRHLAALVCLGRLDDHLLAVRARPASVADLNHLVRRARQRSRWSRLGSLDCHTRRRDVIGRRVRSLRWRHWFCDVSMFTTVSSSSYDSWPFSAQLLRLSTHTHTPHPNIVKEIHDLPAKGNMYARYASFSAGFWRL